MTSPRPNSTVSAIVAHLQRFPAGTKLTGTEIVLALDLGHDVQNPYATLRYAVNAGTLARSKDKVRGWLYWLPAAAPKVKRYSIGWPRGYEQPGVSPFDEGRTKAEKCQITRGATLTAALQQDMRAGGMARIEPGRGSLGRLASDPDAIALNQRIRLGSLG